VEKKATLMKSLSFNFFVYIVYAIRANSKEKRLKFVDIAPTCYLSSLLFAALTKLKKKRPLYQTAERTKHEIMFLSFYRVYIIFTWINTIRRGIHLIKQLIYNG